MQGQETVDMGYQNPVNVKRSTLEMYRISGVAPVTWKEFLYVTFMNVGENVHKVLKEVR